MLLSYPSDYGVWIMLDFLYRIIHAESYEGLQGFFNGWGINCSETHYADQSSLVFISDTLK